MKFIYRSIKTFRFNHKSWMVLMMLSLSTFVNAQQTRVLDTPNTKGEYSASESITLAPGFSTLPGGSFRAFINKTAANCISLNSTPSLGQNYILTHTIKVQGITDASGLSMRNICEVGQEVKYFDGLGRLVQAIQTKGNGAGDKDLIQPRVYDGWGREVTSLLPYSAGGIAGSFRSNAAAEQPQFYNPSTAIAGVVRTLMPWQQSFLEASPLSRPLEKGGAGVDWQPGVHTNRISYTLNDNTSFNSSSNAGSRKVALYTVGINTDGSRSLIRQNNTATYNDNELQVVISRDENWTSGQGCRGTTEEYTDPEGNVVLKRSYNYNGSQYEMLSTYYVYDDFGMLCFVLPPNAEADQGVPSEAVLSELCYQYRYDQKLQQVAKKIPGTEWVYIVYNKSGSVAATQDGKQRTRNEWLITKYDGHGRAVMTGLWNNGNTAITGAALQSLIYQSPQWEKRDNGLANGYSSLSYPFVLNSVLTINYYDDYDFPGLPAVFNRQSTYSKMTRGLLTASRTAVLNNLSHQLWTVHYYDDESRAVEVFKQHYLGGNLNEGNYDELTNTFNYTGQLTASQRKHFSGSSLVLTTVNSFEYDHAGRKTHSYEQVNSGKNVLLSQVGYNELGQQKDKKLHSVDSGGSFAYDRIGYSYNERGWLTEMKSPMFDQVLRYNNPLKPGSVAQFNGNISEQEYRALQSGSQWVAYKYDPLNRILSGNSSEGFTESGISYDKAGNLTSMTRNNYGTLNYTYQNGGKSNRLLSVSGFRSGSYVYDSNGNTTSDQTRDVSIGYNLLNLPQDISGSQVITYTYDADGRKLRKVSGTTVTDYVDGIQYDNGQLAFIQTEEGRVIKSGTSYNYEYTISDHLGNNRVTFDTSNGIANKVGEVSYYPFGYSVQRQLNAGNKYLYNGKELQEELGQYDYGARFYDPVIGRWNVVDPLAELFDDVSPYNYVMNNPVLLVDPDGMAADSIKRDIPKPPIQLKEVIIKSGPMKGLVATGQTGFFAVPYRLPQAVIQVNQAEAAAFLGRWTPLGRVLTIINSLLEMTPKTLNFSKSKEGGSLSKKITDAQRKLIRQWFLKKSNPGDPIPEMPEGIEKETLQTYKAIAEKAIKEGIDKSGEQARRLDMIEAVLK